jgi:hypothetical protein
MLDLKIRYSVKDLTERWMCSEDTIIDLIEDKALPIYCKSYIMTYTSENAQATVRVLRKNTELAAKMPELIKKQRTENSSDNPLDPPSFTVKIGPDSLVEDEDIVEASSDNFAQCFIYLDDIEDFEKKFSIDKTPPLKSTNAVPSPLVQRARDYNQCIAQVISDFTETNGYRPTTVDEVLNRMRYKPPLGMIIDFQQDAISIDGASPKPIKNLIRAIKRLLEEQNKAI